MSLRDWSYRRVTGDGYSRADMDFHRISPSQNAAGDNSVEGFQDGELRIGTLELNMWHEYCILISRSILKSI